MIGVGEEVEILLNKQSMKGLWQNVLMNLKWQGWGRHVRSPQNPGPMENGSKPMLQMQPTCPQCRESHRAAFYITVHHKFQAVLDGLLRLVHELGQIQMQNLATVGQPRCFCDNKTFFLHLLHVACQGTEKLPQCMVKERWTICFFLSPVSSSSSAFPSPVQIVSLVLRITSAVFYSLMITLRLITLHSESFA